MKARGLLLSVSLILAIPLLLVSCGQSGKNYDVVIVGAGGAGMSAAIEAASAGAKVAVLEKLPMVGGSTMLSGGIVYGTGSAAQKKLGIKDSVDDLVKYWSDKSEGVADVNQLRYVAERSGGTIDWLTSMGVVLGDPYPMGTSPVRRAQSGPELGNGITKVLKKVADEQKVEFFLETPAVKLITKNGAVTGVVAKGKDGKEIRFNAKAVIIASGGFDRNKSLMEKYASKYAGVNTIVGMGNTGDGLLMAQAVGADIVSHGGVIGFRGVPGEPTYTTEVCWLMWSWGLAVNKEGKRFVAENSDYPVYHQALNKQTDRTAFVIFDGNTYTKALDAAVGKGVAYVADTIPELAKAAGIDEKGFAETVAEYNQIVKSGNDTQFGKPMKGLKQVVKPKFYALKIEPWTMGTTTGLKIDLDTHVIDTKGQVIPGLFAAGEVANGAFFNQVYPASGTSIQMSLTFGRTAGQKAAQFALSRGK